MKKHIFDGMLSTMTSIQNDFDDVRTAYLFKGVSVGLSIVLVSIYTLIMEGDVTWSPILTPSPLYPSSHPLIPALII